jgi:MFS family permease
MRHQGYEYSLIGVLVAMQGLFMLVSRLPGAMTYRQERGRALMTIWLLVFAGHSVLYPLASGPLYVGAVRALGGFALGMVTTVSLAMYMDALPPDGNKPRFMGFYGGCLAGGFMSGNFSGGLAGDWLGYNTAFGLGAVFIAISLVLMYLDPTSAPRPRAESRQMRELVSLRERLAGSLGQLKAFTEPKVAILAMIAFFTNFLHQVGATYFPLYGISIGMSLTEVGSIKGMHAMTNAIARPVAGPPISRFGHRRVSYFSVAALTLLFGLIPLLQGYWAFLLVFIAIGLTRAVVLVANTVGVVDIDERRISRGMASGLYNASKDGGNLASPMVCGAVASLVGLATMFVVTPAITAVVFFSAAIALANRRRQTEQREVPISVGGV